MGAAVGVKRIDDKVTALGADFTRIPRFPERSTIYANDGKTVLATVYLDNREIVQLDRSASVARQAVLAIEDSDFYQHGAAQLVLADPGGDRERARRAGRRGRLDDHAAAREEHPGSIPTTGRFERKFQELALAIRVEQKYTKDQILELYLNQVYLATASTGSAPPPSTTSTSRPRSSRSTQGATLAGMIRRPSLLRPDHAPTKSRPPQRRAEPDGRARACLASAQGRAGEGARRSASPRTPACTAGQHAAVLRDLHDPTRSSRTPTASSTRSARPGGAQARASTRAASRSSRRSTRTGRRYAQAAANAAVRAALPYHPPDRLRPTSRSSPRT